MKYSKLYIIPVLVAAIASCTKVQGPENGVFPEGGEVRISASVDAAGTSGTGVMAFKTKGAGSPATWAEGSTPYAGGTLGLFLDYGKGSTYTQSNVLWENNGSNSWSSQTRTLWGKASEPVGVYAYAPYDAGQTKASGVEFIIPTDQSEGLGAADLLWWYPGIENGTKADVTAGSFTDGKIDIAFRHALIKLTVNFELASQFKGKDITIKEAWYHQSMEKVGINFTGSDSKGVPYVGMGPTAGSSASSIKMHNCSANGNLSCELLFFPYPFSEGSKLLTVTLSDGRDYILTPDYNFLGFWENTTTNGYVTGIAYEMTVTVGKDKLEMGSVTVANWIDKGSVGDNFWTDADEYSEWGGPEDIATEYAGGDGSKDDPFQIATAAQLAYMAQETKNGKYYNEFKYFELTSNIDLKGFDWTPIGTQAYGFAGVFDGGGNVITNLKVSGDNDRAGLFGTVSAESDGTEIKDLVIRNASVSAASSNAGIVAGHCYLPGGKCTISGCKVDGNVVSNCFAGGILGSSYGDISADALLIENCTADVNCTVENGQQNASCGGIAGRLDRGVIRGCTVLGKVEGTFNVGGLAGCLYNGDINSPFNYVYAEVGISKASGKECHIGGLVGDVDGLEIHSILNCRMYGKVWCAEGLSASIYIGGAVGYACSVKLENLCFYGSVVAGKPADERELYAGAFIGWLTYEVTASRCTYQIDGTAGLPVCGFVLSMDDVSGLDIVGKR